MLSNYLVAYLIGHIVGDFYFQSKDLSDEKNTSNKALLKHIIVYGVCMMVSVLLFAFSVKAFVGAVVLGVLHGVVDWGKVIFARKNKFSSRCLYVSDQVIHVICLMLVAIIIEALSLDSFCKSSIPEFIILALLSEHAFDLLSGVSFSADGNIALRFSSLVLAVMLVIKPTNITFSQCFSEYKPPDDAVSESEVKTGGLIGSIERLLILLLAALGQYAAIALIVAAKSMARYKQISENKAFAEYYLLGTLFSVLFALLVGVLLIA